MQVFVKARTKYMWTSIKVIVKWFGRYIHVYMKSIYLYVSTHNRDILTKSELDYYYYYVVCTNQCAYIIMGLR